MNPQELMQENISRMQEIVQRIDQLKEAGEDLAETVCRDAIDGWGTLTDIQRFSLLAKNGHYDSDDIAQYERLQSDITLYKGELACSYAVQSKMQKNFCGLEVVMRFFYLDGTVCFNSNHQLIEIGILYDRSVHFSNTFGEKTGKLNSLLHLYAKESISLKPLMASAIHTKNPHVDFETSQQLLMPAYLHQNIERGTRNVEKLFMGPLSFYDDCFRHAVAMLQEQKRPQLSLVKSS